MMLLGAIVVVVVSVVAWVALEDLVRAMIGRVM